MILVYISIDLNHSLYLHALDRSVKYDVQLRRKKRKAHMESLVAIGLDGRGGSCLD